MFGRNGSAKKEKKDRNAKYRFSEYPFLKAIKPREFYLFHSDYFQVDGYYACILMFVHNSAAEDKFGPFWGVNRIPFGLPDGVVTINFEQISRMSESWVSDHQDKAETVASKNMTEQVNGGKIGGVTGSNKKVNDLVTISSELNNGASYLNVHNRLLVKAPTLALLEQSLDKIERLYADRFGTLWAAPYIGDQRRELSQLFSPNEKKKGKGFHFTSTEFAGSYSLVTHGLEDVDGEYVGFMVGDVNNSAVLFNPNRFHHHVVVGSEQYNMARNRAHVADMWGSKIGQSALMNGHRVVHLLLDTCDMSKLGPEFKSFTSVIDMNHGDVNMFEMFGKVEDELSIYPSQMQKLILMAEQAYAATDADRAVIRGSLEEIATQFYIDQRMWYENAEQNRERLRIVGIPHDEVPRLPLFVSYLDQAYNTMVNSSNYDPEKLHALNVLSMTFRNLLSSNGDLFDTQTTPVIDNVVGGRRVIYDFSTLLGRGQGVAMAQLVNIVDFAVAQLSAGDVLIIHAAENIDGGVWDYIEVQLDKLYKRGGRVAFLYNNVDKMLKNVHMNRFDTADYTIFGNMSANHVQQYKEKLGQDLPEELGKLVTDKSESVTYIRRGLDNVCFRMDLKLDAEPLKRKRRR